MNETEDIVGDAGFRYGRRRAERYARHLNAKRILFGLGPTHRFVVRKVGWCRYHVIALQNRADARYCAHCIGTGTNWDNANAPCCVSCRDTGVESR